MFKGNKYGKQQTQTQIQLTAHQKKLVFKNFYNALESLEEYIEKIQYPSFKKQIFTKSINDANRLPDELADDFLTFLFLFKAIIDKKPEFLRKEVQEEYYKWISATGINANNCPEKLKHFLFEINEILEGRGEKLVKQTRELINDGKEVNPKDMIKVFGALQQPLNENRKEGKLLDGKTHKDIEIESKFEADSEQGEQVFKQIAGKVSNSHQDFSFIQSKMDIDDELASENYQRRAFIENIKQNIKDWNIEEVMTFNGHRYDFNRKDWIRYDKEKFEIMLIKKSVEKKYNEWGGLEIVPEKMYLKYKFSDNEWLEIQYAIAQRKLRHPEEMENWENYEETKKWAQKLESEIQSRNLNQVAFESQTVQSPKNDKSVWNKYGGSGLFGSLSLLSLLFFLA